MVNNSIFGWLVKVITFLAMLAMASITSAAPLDKGWNLVNPGVMGADLPAEAYVYDTATKQWSKVTSLAANQGAWVNSSAEGTFTVDSTAGNGQYSSIIAGNGWYLLGAGATDTTIKALKTKIDGAISGSEVTQIYEFSNGGWVGHNLEMNPSDASALTAGQGLWVAIGAAGSPPLFKGLVSLDTSGAAPTGLGRRLYSSDGSTSSLGETSVLLYSCEDEDYETPLTDPITAAEDGSYEVSEEDFIKSENAKAESCFGVKATVSAVEIEEDGTVKAKAYEVVAIKPETEKGEVVAEVVVDPFTHKVAAEIRASIKQSTLLGGLTLSSNTLKIMHSLAESMVADYRDQAKQGKAPVELATLESGEAIEVAVDKTKQEAMKAAYDELQTAKKDTSGDAAALVKAAEEKLATAKQALSQAVTNKKSDLRKVGKVVVQKLVSDGGMVATGDLDAVIASGLISKTGASGGAATADEFKAIMDSSFDATTVAANRKLAEANLASTTTSGNTQNSSRIAQFQQQIKREAQEAAFTDDFGDIFGSTAKGRFGPANLDGNIKLARIVYSTVVDLAQMGFAVSDGDGGLVVALHVPPSESRMLPGAPYRIAVQYQTFVEGEIPEDVEVATCSNSIYDTAKTCLADSNEGNTWTTYVGGDPMLRVVDPDTDLRTPHPSWAEEMMELLYTPIIPNVAVYSMIKNRDHTVTFEQLNQAIIDNAGGSKGSACKDSESDSNVDCFENLYGLVLTTDPYSVAKSIVSKDMATHLRGEMDHLLMKIVDEKMSRGEDPLTIAKKMIDLLKPASDKETEAEFFARIINAEPYLLDMMTDEYIDTLVRAIPAEFSDSDKSAVLQLKEGFTLAKDTELQPKTALAFTVLMVNKFVSGEGNVEFERVPADQTDLSWMLGDALEKVLQSGEVGTIGIAGVDPLQGLIESLFAQNESGISASSVSDKITKIWWPKRNAFSTEILSQLQNLGLADNDGDGEIGESDIEWLYSNNNSSMGDELWDAIDKAEKEKEDFDGDQFILAMFKKLTGDTRLTVEPELKKIFDNLMTYVDGIQEKIEKIFGERARYAGFESIDEHVNQGAFDDHGYGGGNTASTHVEITIRDNYNWQEIGDKFTAVALVPLVFDRYEMREHPEYSDDGNSGAKGIQLAQGTSTDSSDTAIWHNTEVPLYRKGNSVSDGGDFYETSDTYKVYVELGGEWVVASDVPLFPMGLDENNQERIQQLDVPYFGGAGTTNQGDTGGYMPHGPEAGFGVMQEGRDFFKKGDQRSFFYPAIKVKNDDAEIKSDGTYKRSDLHMVGEELLSYDGTKDQIRPKTKTELMGVLQNATVNLFVLAKNHEEKDKLYSRNRDDLTELIAKVRSNQEVETASGKTKLSPAPFVGFFDNYWSERGGCADYASAESGECVNQHSNYDKAQYGVEKSITNGGIVLVDIVPSTDSRAIPQQLLLEVNMAFESADWHEVELVLRSTDTDSDGPDSVFDTDHFEFKDNFFDSNNGGVDAGSLVESGAFGRGLAIEPDGKHVDNGSWNDDFGLRIKVFDDALLQNHKNRIFIVLRSDDKMALFVNEMGSDLGSLLGSKIELKKLLSSDGYDDLINKTGEFLNTPTWLDKGNVKTAIGQAAQKKGNKTKLKADHLNKDTSITVDVVMIESGYDTHARVLDEQLLKETQGNANYDGYSSLIDQLLFEVLMPVAKGDAVFMVGGEHFDPNAEENEVHDWSAGTGMQMDNTSSLSDALLSSGDKLYIANERSDHITQLSSGGTTKKIGEGFMGSAGLAVAANGDLYISDDKPAIYRVANGTTNVVELPIRNELSNPNALAINGDQLAVADAGGRILAIDISNPGAIDPSKVRVLVDGYDTPQAVAYGKDELKGDLFFTDFSGSIFRIPDSEAANEAEYYTPDWGDTAIKVTEFGYTEDRVGGIVGMTQGGLAIDNDGVMYASDYDRAGVYRIHPNTEGDKAASAEEILRIDGWYPTRGLVLSPDNKHLYVTAYDQDEVLMLDLYVADGNKSGSNADEIASSVKKVMDNEGGLLQGPFGMVITTSNFDGIKAPNDTAYEDPNKGNEFLDTHLSAYEVQYFDRMMSGDAKLIFDPVEKEASGRAYIRSEDGDSLPSDMTVTLRQINDDENCEFDGWGIWKASSCITILGKFTSLQQSGEWELGAVKLNDDVDPKELFILVQAGDKDALTGRFHMEYLHY